MNKAITFISSFGKPFRLALTRADEDGYRICSLGSVCSVDTDDLRTPCVSAGDTVLHIYGYLGKLMSFKAESQKQEFLALVRSVWQ